MSMFLIQSCQLYYFKYVLDKPNLVGLVSTLNFVVLLPSLYATTLISKKWAKSNCNDWCSRIYRV